MQLKISRNDLITPLSIITGVVERKQTMPILANLLLSAEQDGLTLTATNLEVELVARVSNALVEVAGDITLPAKKLLDICRSLPESSQLELSVNESRLRLRSGSSEFSLSTLPAENFPNLQVVDEDIEFSVEQQALKKMIDATGFAMAQQDVRYYLNGMLMELTSNRFTLVATDGHRLAYAHHDSDQPIAVEGEAIQAIIPRKGIYELNRLLTDPEDKVKLGVSRTHLIAHTADYRFTSKLIDGKFPDYRRVIPRGGDKILIADRDEMKAMLQRASILSHEKIRGVRLIFSNGNLQVQANNPEHEEALDSMEVGYDGEELQMGFNVGYLIDVLNVIETENVQMTLLNANSSALLESIDENSTAQYVVMPMRL